MIVELEKLKKMRLAVSTLWTTMDADSMLAEDVRAASVMLMQISDDLELFDTCVIEKGGKT